MKVLSKQIKHLILNRITKGCGDLKEVLLSGLLAVTLVSCKGKTPEPQTGTNPLNESTAPKKSGGGSDTSGGNFELVTQQDIEKLRIKVLQNLKIATYRVQQEIQFSTKQFGRLDTLFSNDEYHKFNAFINSTGRIGVLPFRALDAELIKLEIVENACNSQSTHPTDGAAYYDSAGTPTICLSANRIRNLSPQSVELDVVALAFHELSHLYGFDESDAQFFQTFILKQKSVMWPPSELLIQKTIQAERLASLIIYQRQLLSQKVNNSQLCFTIAQSFEAGNHLFQTFSDELPLLQSRISQLGVVMAKLIDLRNLCENENYPFLRETLDISTPSMFDYAYATLYHLSRFINPDAPIRLLQYDNILALFEIVENWGEANSFPKPEITQRAITDLQCRVFISTTKKPTETTEVNLYNDTFAEPSDPNRHAYLDLQNSRENILISRDSNQKGFMAGIIPRDMKITFHRGMIPFSFNAKQNGFIAFVEGGSGSYSFEFEGPSLSQPEKYKRVICTNRSSTQDNVTYPEREPDATLDSWMIPFKTGYTNAKLLL